MPKKSKPVPKHSKPIMLPRTRKARNVGVLENMAKTGKRFAMSKRVRGGIEFEFASSIPHAEFADKLAVAVGVDRRTVFMSDTYVDSDSNKDYSVWRVERDGSIPEDAKHKFKIEVVSPALPVNELLQVTPTVLKLIHEYGKTSNLTGMHTTLSVPGVNIAKKLDVVKLIVLLNEQYYGEEFGRLDAEYAKLQVPRLIQRVRSDNNYATLRDALEHFITKPYRISDKVLAVEKRTSINLSKADKHNLIEFRLPGGTGYEKKWLLIQRMVWHFAAAIAAACDENAYIKDYVKQLLRLIEDTRPSPGDPLANKKHSTSGVRLQWLKRKIDGGIQWSLVDVTDGPVEQSKTWAERHLILKIVTRFNSETGSYDALGVGEGSGWNPSLVENVEGGVEDRRLERLRQHVIRNRHPYKRQALKVKKGADEKELKGFYDSRRTPADYYAAIIKRLTDPTANISLPANHMTRSYLGIDVDPRLALQLLSNPSMIPYVSWYFSDLGLRKRINEIPAQVAYSVARQKQAPPEELAELAAAYVVTETQVPRWLLIRACRDHSIVEFTRVAYALLKRAGQLDRRPVKILIDYLTKLSKFPSKRVELLHAYADLYATRNTDKQQAEWKPAQQQQQKQPAKTNKQKAKR